ncbi:hypothetical protein HK098_000426 [Nowakowskiella sp. JEL0407]|nr:hypothetical protein HK098_000426 [Nowakowskiella sp. JEL0407]
MYKNESNYIFGKQLDRVLQFVTNGAELRDVLFKCFGDEFVDDVLYPVTEREEDVISAPIRVNLRDYAGKVPILPSADLATKLDAVLHSNEEMEPQTPALPRALSSVDFKYESPLIAIVGAGCRFPGDINSTTEFWNALSQGQSVITDLPTDRKSFKGVTMPLRGGFLSTTVVEGFDCPFFAMSPNEAKLMDPQQRVLLETAYSALEDAGISVNDIKGSDAGVFISARSVGHDARMSEAFGETQPRYVVTGADHSFCSGRISHTFDLKGPSFTMSSACSSGGILLDLASKSLADRQCSVAIIGAATVVSHMFAFNMLSAAGIMSQKLGRCATYDKDADGYVPTESSVCFVLKRLDDAIQNGDKIMGVLGSIANTHKGTEGLGITSPGPNATAFAIKECLKLSGLHADEIDFLEAHGTGTKAGDTLEATAIANAFSERTTPLLVGACKAGFGHTENVATLTSLLKVCLAMRHSTIPPTLLDKTRMNPEVESQFKKIQADVPTTNVPWPDSSTNDEIKRAVVMSAGLSGTVVTLSVRSASSKETDVIVARPEDDPISILTISATSLNALERQKNNYVEVLRNPPTEIMETDFIKELCVNSNVRRTHFKYRITAQAKSISELVSVLDAPLSTLVDSKPASKNVVFVFPGHGSFDRKLCQDLYRQVEAFRQSIDECDTALQNLEFSTSILDSVKGLSSELISSEFEQVILLIMQYSVAKMYQRIGIEPTCVIGHSFGEIVAATVAGGISLENAIEMMWHRQILLERPECEGRMLSVMIDIETLNALLTSSKTDLDIAAYNGINQYVLSGSIKSINEMKEYLSEKKIPFRELANIVAFHSRQVYDASVEFGDRIKEIYTPQPLNVPFVSSLEASVFEVSATIPTGHWAQHIREPVQFSEAIKNAATYFENAVVIEMGSGSIGSLAKRHLVDLKSKNAKDIKSKNQTNFLPTFPDWSSTFSTLYRFGLNIDWKSIHGKTVYGSHVELPLYPFVRNNVWDDLELIHKFRSSGMDMLPPQKEYYAVVGVGIRLPRNVCDLDKFWNLMKNDKRFLPSDLFGAQERLSFDSDFFGMDDVTAAEVSPAFRMLLETSHHALEWLNSDLSNRQGGIFVCKENDLSEFEMGILAKHLGFKNPYTQTISGERESCLSLLQAAFKTLKSGQCDVALVGSSFSMGDAEDISDDSRCEVAVSLVLKTLEDAESDRDRILCLLDGRVPECANIRDLRNQLTKQVDAFMSDVFSESGSIDMILQNLEKFDKSDAALICQKRDHPIMISQAQSFLDSALSSSLFHSIVATALMMNQNTFVGCDPELNSVVGAWENKDGKSRNALVSLKGTNGIVYGVVISQPPAKFDIPKLREFRRKTVFYSPKSYHSNNSEEQKLSLKLHSFNVDTENIRWMNDHKIASSNAAIVPGSALVNFAMRTVRSQSIDVDFLKPWLNPGNNLLVDIKPKSSNQFAIGSNGTEFCAVTIQDTIATVSSENINDNLVILQFTGTNVDPQLWYESGNSAISYGPQFRLVKEVWSLPDEGVLGRISIDDAENNSFWTISPTLLDACFHLMAIVDSTGGLPAKLEGLKIRTRDGEKFPSDVWCRHIPLKSFSEKHRKASKIRVYDAESGREVLTIDRFIIQLPSSASSNAVQSFNDYSILWQRSWLPFDVHHTSDSDVKSSTLCILIGFKSEMMNYIKSLYEHTIEIDSTQDVDTQLRLLDWKQYGRVGVKRTRVTYCGSQLLGSLSLSTSSEWWNIDRAYKLIEVFKALNSLAIDESAREILSDLSTIAVLWGSTSLGPELVDAARLSVAGAILNAGTELDIPANILDLSSMGKDAFEAVEKILKTSNISSTSGWYAERNGIWYISSYKHLNSLRKVTIESQNHTNGNILIIGGVGGLSSAIAKRIISMKFAKVTLAGRRSKEDKSVKQVISELGNVQYVQLDITNAQEVMKLIRSDSYTGIINAAGVLRDSLLYRVDESSLRHVGDPKVQGSLAILEAVSKYSNLCNVIFVSSIGAGIGSRGQTSYVMSNSVMDGVATQYSKSTTKNPNVTVHSVQLGLVKGVGMAKGADLGHMMSAVTISEDQAVNVLLAYLSADQKSSGGMPVLVAPLDLPPPVVTRPRGFSVSVSQDRTSKLSENDVSEFLSEQLMIAMGFEDKPEFDVPLLQLGLDSLASVSIQRAINQNYGEDIPLQEILNGTIDSLTELIVKQCNVVTISEKTEDSHVRDSDSLSAEILSPFRSSVIFDLLTYHANTRPDAAFLEYGNETKVQISYSECLDLVKTMANKINDALQSEKITTAACIFSSSAETMITTLATWKLGIVTAMLGPNTQASLLSRQLRSVKCEAIFVLDSDYQLGLTLSKSLSLPLVVFSRKTTVSYDYAIIISDILVSESKAESTTFPVQTPDSPVCWIFSSSSVDGESVKGIRLTHRQMIENCKARDELWMNEGDVFSSMVNGGRVLTWLPFSHVMGLIVDFVNNGLFAGMTICLRPSGSSPATPQTLLDDIESVKPDLMYVVPWILNGWRSLCMTDSKATENRIKGILKSLKAIISGGAPLKPSAWEWLAKSKIPVWEAMGTSETAGTIFTGVPLLTTQNSEGWMRPLPYIEIRLDKAVGWKEKNTGLLVLKSDIITKEIVSVKPGESCENVNIVNPTHNTEGYFSTGDIFESRINPKNDQVEYRFISRADDAVLLSTGFSIAPRMFEESLVSEIPHLKHACLLQDNATNGVLLVLQLDIANPPKDSSVTFPSRGQMISLIGPIRRRTAPDLNLSAADLVLLDASFAMPLSPKGTILRGRLRKILKCQ